MVHEDAREINIHDAAELAYWLKVFDTSHEELLVAVANVGPHAGRVTEFLARGSSSEPTPAGPLPDGG